MNLGGLLAKGRQAPTRTLDRLDDSMNALGSPGRRVHAARCTVAHVRGGAGCLPGAAGNFLDGAGHRAHVGAGALHRFHLALGPIRNLAGRPGHFTGGPIQIFRASRENLRRLCDLLGGGLHLAEHAEEGVCHRIEGTGQLRHLVPAAHLHPGAQVPTTELRRRRHQPPDIAGQDA